MIYDLIIIGAGAAGLFAGASLPSPLNGLIIEKSSNPGRKLLMSGAGQCNVTHGGSIKDFIFHYGKNGSKIRSILYGFNNQSVISFFQTRGISLYEREDGKIFPQSLNAQDILNVLINSCKDNGLVFKFSSPVTNIALDDISNKNETSDKSLPIYTVSCDKTTYRTKKLIIATGGCSYPTTGSDGSFFSVLESLGININTIKPALVPIYVHNYPYKDLSGISFSNAKISIYNKKSESDNHLNNPNFNIMNYNKIAENTDSLLLTHGCFSGPAILNISRFTATSNLISINYFPNKSSEIIFRELKEMIYGTKKQIISVLSEYFNNNLTLSSSEIPKRFLERICTRCDVEPNQKSSQLSVSSLKEIIKLITNDTFIISNLGGFNIAMVTTGGVSLDDINLKNLESIKFPNLFFAGEVLDVDGDTGGYNLQFAFSSGYIATH